MATFSSRRATAAVVAVVAALALTACGSDADSKDSESAVTSPEEHIADDATVTAGLGRMSDTAAAILATVSSGTKVDDAQDQLEIDWQQVEGAVLQNDKDLYLQVEDALGGIDRAARAGDAAETTRFAADLTTAITAYLTKHP